MTHPLQTKEWGKFRKDWGNEILHTKYGLITVHKIPFLNKKLGMFIRGPKPTATMLTGLKKIAAENNLVFIKLEPNVAKNENIAKLLRNNGCVKGKTLFTPTSFVIDLSRPEDALLASFKSKTRYNIRLADRKGVVVAEDNSPEAFDKHIALTRETVERQGFYAHSEKYHRMMWQHLHEGKKPIARLLTAQYQNKIIATWILFIGKDTLYYPYGASTHKHKNLMASSLMMWEAIKLGKKLGLKKFDLWGREPGKGFTKFKEGFSPEVVKFIGTWDLVINKNMYYAYKVADFFRWKYLRLRSSFSKPSF